MTMPTNSADPRTPLSRADVLSGIPAFPPVVLRVLSLLSRKTIEIRHLVREITCDATLSAEVLRIANSPLFAHQVEIDTVRHAVVALGLSRVHSLVMNIATANYMRSAIQTDALAKCWRHSVASAVVSSELACAGGLPPDRAYTLGLLHDIGRLGLLVGFPVAYQDILSEADRDGVSLLDLEERRFGMDHCEVGRLLIEKWGLPLDFRVVAGRHHDPPQGNGFDMLRIVHLSCRFADALGYSAIVPLTPMTFEELRESLPSNVQERLPDEDKLKALVASGIGEDKTDLATPPAAAHPPARISNSSSAEQKLKGPPLEDREFGGSAILRDLGIILITVAIFSTLLIVVTKYVLF